MRSGGQAARLRGGRSARGGPAQAQVDGSASAGDAEDPERLVHQLGDHRPARDRSQQHDRQHAPDVGGDQQHQQRHPMCQPAQVEPRTLQPGDAHEEHRSGPQAPHPAAGRVHVDQAALQHEHRLGGDVRDATLGQHVGHDLGAQAPRRHAEVQLGVVAQRQDHQHQQQASRAVAPGLRGRIQAQRRVERDAQQRGRQGVDVERARADHEGQLGQQQQRQRSRRGVRRRVEVRARRA